MERDGANEFLGLVGEPAYVRRGRAVEDALNELLGTCRHQRDQWLVMVRVRLGLLHGLAGDWFALLPLLKDEQQLRILQELYRNLSPRPRSWIEPTTSRRVVVRVLREMIESIERFNRRWQAFLPTVNLSSVNAAREAYNRYYLLEKECAVRSANVARQGFRRLEPFTTEDLALLLPVLPVPKLEGESS